MQLIKNLYLHRKKTLSRKLEEVCLAWLIERNLSKQELITVYLNIVEFGRDLFGIKEAAKSYFDKEPIDLTPEEISALTRLLPGPRLYESFFRRKRLSRAYTNRVNRLLKLLQKRGYITSDEWSPITKTSLWDRPPPKEPSDDEGLDDDLLEDEALDDEEELDLDDEDSSPDQQRRDDERPQEDNARRVSPRGRSPVKSKRRPKSNRRRKVRELSDPF
jgi:membrane peptidoglycan carboxypeptidase